MSLPPIFKAGAPVSTQEWEQHRRPELLQLFGDHVYGHIPQVPASVSFATVKREQGLYGNSVHLEQVEATVQLDGARCSFLFTIYTPASFTGKLPAVIMIDPFSLSAQFQDPDRTYRQLPPDLVTKAGFVAVHAHVDGLCRDDAQRAYEGFLALFPQDGERGGRAISVWAWATSRVVDYLMGCNYVDGNKIAVNGCSRAGKTALWCAANDERIALILSNVSGCSGAAITRGKTGERIGDITQQFPHWFCEAYAGYADREEYLPVDQHMLLALCAPRPLYTASASDDEWADPAKEFESCVQASQVYALYNKGGLGDAVFPPVNTPLMAADMGYHLREGVHGCFVYDWEQYIRFMQMHFAADNKDIS